MHLRCKCISGDAKLTQYWTNTLTQTLMLMQTHQRILTFTAYMKEKYSNIYLLCIAYYTSAGYIIQYCWLLEFYNLATCKIISERVPTCDSARSWWLYSAVPLGDQVASTMTCYPTQSHYPDIKLTRPCPLLLMLRASIGSNKYQFGKLLVWPNCRSPALEARPLSI